MYLDQSSLIADTHRTIAASEETIRLTLESIQRVEADIARSLNAVEMTRLRLAMNNHRQTRNVTGSR
jgi:hypothetical protein